jgi:DNA-binding CsgD family transcriptional regulator
VSDLFKKTGTGRRTELVRWALKYGFVDVDESG